MRQRDVLAAVTILTVLAGSLLAAHAASPGGGARFTRYNLHYQDKLDRKGNHVYEASYTGWVEPGTGHGILPLGTAVALEKGGGKFWEKGFTLVIQDPGKLNPPVSTIFVENEPKRTGKNAQEYFELITSPEPVGPGGFPARDQEGIKAGKALPGMSRKGVLAALGYPAAHETPSLEQDTYTYWRDRFRRLVVTFNEAGTVVSVK